MNELLVYVLNLLKQIYLSNILALISDSSLGMQALEKVL